ncbi:MAG: ABC transporter permease, partial [Limisphaerales bacterium]
SPSDGGRDGERGKIETALLKNLDPASVGLVFQNVREQALAASSQSQDFGQLFLGFSFFLVTAALLLMAMLFQFGLEQRSTEIGTMLALGFTPKRVRRLFLGEGIFISLLGGILGVAGGIFYAKAMLLGLTTIWRAAIGTSSLYFHLASKSLIIGLFSSVILNAIIIWVSMRNHAKRPVHELLGNENVEFQSADFKSPKRNFAKGIFLISGLAATALIGLAIFKHETNAAGIFFGGGALLLISGLAGALLFLRKIGGSNAAAKLSLAGLGLRSCSRRRNRSIATIALLASGCFLIVSVGANKLDSNLNSEKRSSGTGGFAFVGETTLPVVKNLNEKSGREFFGLDEKRLAESKFVPMRVHDGDEASCLNLNRAQTPRLLGVNPEELQSRGAFTFAKIAKEFEAHKKWLLLKRSQENEIAAIGDAASIQYALGKKVGDTLDYLDERGNRFKIGIVASVANSILQGSLLIDGEEFKKKFPSANGYRMFLIDAPSKNANEISAELSRAMQDFGLELTPAAQRLAAFNAVQNTYLNTFQILGGLGLLLGSFGLGVVVLRNVLERRSELAVLKAVGFRARSLRWIILSEHGALLFCGLGLGIFASLIAILPTLLSPGKELSYRSLAWTLAAVFCNGLLWTWLATKFALRGELLKALRNE